MNIDFTTLKGKIHGGLLYFLSFYGTYELLFQPYDGDKWEMVIVSVLWAITMAILDPRIQKLSKKRKKEVQG